jgi:hypothetical protein
MEFHIPKEEEDLEKDVTVVERSNLSSELRTWL